MLPDAVAVIPTFRPPASVRELINDLIPIVGTIVVADDASPCTYDSVLRDVGRETSVDLVRFSSNAGIARSLNVGLLEARSQGARWLLTVDQDSQFTAGYVEALRRDIERVERSDVRVGVIAPNIVTATGDSIEYPIDMHAGWATTAEVFQSGALWSVQALSECGGFDESLAIDGVDSEACLSLRERGYRLMLSPAATITHDWGKSRPISLLGKTVFLTNHSPERRRSMVRNRVKLLPRELRQSPRQGIRSIRRLSVNTALAVSLEGERLEKARASLDGLLSALRHQNVRADRPGHM